ncbi:helix-turn-helix domain-containing protein [Leptospira kmetyi]|uniref:HTH araC/xylS-type domain-containing protein n=1 Tax=Leptospira kmetyi TaxID=408139 RepID=A0ABX4NAJ0_9LEPT|nr:helix-turn-helix domain-containing protein [Leptospira kmetyi]PJZ29127.1 hypothetical protein CH378_14680 [Leptospira kmetyi]PJZ39706.1 hypothetical protein CH370_19835 [Leptospira kmetyi]
MNLADHSFTSAIRRFCGNLLPQTLKRDKEDSFKDVPPDPTQNEIYLKVLRNVDFESVEFRLNEFLSKKGFKDEELRLPDFAAELGLSLHQASYYLNKNLKTTFTDFMNFNRLEEAKLLIFENGKKFNLLEVCYASGFNSLATFHRACRKFAKCTPKELRFEIIERKNEIRSISGYKNEI